MQSCIFSSLQCHMILQKSFYYVTLDHNLFLTKIDLLLNTYFLLLSLLQKVV